MKKSISFLLLILLFISCERQSKLNLESSLPDETDDLRFYEVLKDEFVTTTTEQSSPAGDQSSQNETIKSQVAERKLIRRGQLLIEVKDIEKARLSITKICKQLNAYVANERQNNYGYRLQQTLEIRVPFNVYDSLIASVEKQAYRIENKNIQVEDVTEEFIDVQARVKTKKEVESRYIGLLKQARNVEEILAIEKQIAALRGDIESMEGRLNFLQDKVSYSTLTLTFYQVIGTDFGFGSKFLNAALQGWDNLLIFLIGLTHAWPFLIILSVSVWIGIRSIRNRNRNNVKSVTTEN